MTQYNATIKGNTPSKSNCYMIAHKRLIKTKRLKDYEESFYIQLPPELRNIDITSYFEFYVDVFYPSQRADLDNSLKIILDCLQKTKTIRNDNKCVKIVAQKALDKENPRIEFTIKPIE
jgi:Holliday junction resolvase RusA-like endonuclease